MMIQFYCSQCDKLLHSKAETAGQKAKCPACGHIMQIPAASAPASENAPVTNPFADPAPASPGQASLFTGNIPDPDNPYASPTTAAMDDRYDPDDTFTRDGPPWEREGQSAGTFWKTAKLIFTSTPIAFRSMRREGGLGAPLGFAVVGGVIGFLVLLALQLLFQVGMGVAIGGIPGAAGQVGMGGIGFLCTAVVMLIVMPIAVVLGLFIHSGLTHLALILLGGARYPFETTFRVVAYSTGATSLLMLIPLCGVHINGIVNIVFIILGLSAAQEISGLKATGAVLLPLVICVGSVIGLVLGIFGIAFAFGNAF